MSGPQALAALAGLYALLAAGAALPTPWRPAARAAAAFAVVFSPVLGVAAWLATQETEPGTWLVLAPLFIAWAILVDLRAGVSARLARTGPPPRGRARSAANGEGDPPGASRAPREDD